MSDPRADDISALRAKLTQISRLMDEADGKVLLVQRDTADVAHHLRSLRMSLNAAYDELDRIDPPPPTRRPARPPK